MASLFQLKVVTPEREVLDDMVEGIILRTTEGDMGILKGHAGHVSAIKSGRVKINTQNGAKYGVASDGFVRVGKEVTTLLCTTFEWLEDIDVERAKLSLEKSKAQLNSAETPEDASVAKSRIARAKARISLVETQGK